MTEQRFIDRVRDIMIRMETDANVSEALTHAIPAAQRRAHHYKAINTVAEWVQFQQMLTEEVAAAEGTVPVAEVVPDQDIQVALAVTLWTMGHYELKAYDE
jgi:hypothetical protein